MERTAAALEANGMTVRRAKDAAEAKRIVLGPIPGRITVVLVDEDLGFQPTKGARNHDYQSRDR